jgi:hypothetical protein
MMQDNPDMAQRFPGGGNMPQQLLDMLNHGEDIGALWEGLLAEIAIRGGLGGGGGDGGGGAGEGAVQEDGEDERNQMPGGIEPGDEGAEEAVDEEEDGAEEDMPEVNSIIMILFISSLLMTNIFLTVATIILPESIRKVLQLWRWRGNCYSRTQRIARAWRRQWSRLRSTYLEPSFHLWSTVLSYSIGSVMRKLGLFPRNALSYRTSHTKPRKPNPFKSNIGRYKRV